MNLLLITITIHQAKVAIGVSVSILVLLALGATVLFVFRRNSGFDYGGGEKNIDNLDYRGIENTFAGAASETAPIVQTAHTSSLVQPAPIYNLHKTYVDPHTYEDPQVQSKMGRNWEGGSVRD